MDEIGLLAVELLLRVKALPVDHNADRGLPVGILVFAHACHQDLLACAVSVQVDQGLRVLTEFFDIASLCRSVLSGEQLRILVKRDPCLQRAGSVRRDIGSRKDKADAVAFDHPCQIVIILAKSALQQTVLHFDRRSVRH